MLQVARLAANPLRESLDLVLDFVHGQRLTCGGFADRAGRADLYYSGFGVQCLAALQAELPGQNTADYLNRFADDKGLDTVHLASLVRCRATCGLETDESLRQRTLEKLSECRTDDGGWNQDPGAAACSTYGCFLATGCLQDLNEPLPDAGPIGAALETLATGDGGYANDPALKIANTPATAAAVTLQHQYRLPIDPKSVRFLFERHYAEGGFFAMAEAPMPDLLSTATALHALSAAGADLDPVREPCLDFCNSLWSSRGAFYGNWAEEEDDLDVEYTYYGLLALGHLSV